MSGIRWRIGQALRLILRPHARETARLHAASDLIELERMQRIG